jgi:hypothetical protein
MSLPGGTIPGGGGSLWGGGGGAGGGMVNPVYLGRGILYPALRKAGITLGPQRTPSPAQYQDAIEELNRLIGSLNCDRLFIYTKDRIIAPLTGEKTYTMGVSADPNVIPDIEAPRPEGIEAANILTVPGELRYPLAIVTDLQWAQISMQDAPNSIPEILYDDRGYPLSTLYLYGQPVTGAFLELFCWQLVPQFLTPDDQVLLPPGYEDALVLNLAVRLAPHFQKVLDQNVREDARISLMRLMSINAPQPIADTPGLCGAGPYNIYSDQFRR